MERTLALIERSHRGDKGARNTLAEENMGLVWSIVRRFLNRGVEKEDLFQIGSIGLLKAIDKFDTGYDVCFSTYAVPMIAGEIKRFLRDDGMIRVSRSLKELSVKAWQSREELERQLGREPTVTEIAGELGIEVEELSMAMEAGADVESLQQVIYQGDGTEITLMDKLENNDEPTGRVLDRMLLEGLLKRLDAQEKQLILMRYYQEKTQSAIAEKLGISQVQVSRMEKRILKKLREFT
ncbi:MAG TPA: RNA polymerase sigma-G factor [Lachnospiraceae bacterium]|nr:RNA polymerase sigma-G factor [Lachnospiraceae bacterium]